MTTIQPPRITKPVTPGPKALVLHVHAGPGTGGGTTGGRARCATAPVAAPTAPLAMARAAATAAPPATGRIGRPVPTPPSEPGKPDLGPRFQLMRVVVEQALGRQRQHLASLEEAYARAPHGSPQRTTLEAELAIARRDLAVLERAAAAVRRAEANPATTEADATALNQLVLRLTGPTTDTERLRTLARLEGHVRDIGRTPPSDQGLQHKLYAHLERTSHLRDAIRNLTDALRGAMSPAERQKIQLQIARLERHLACADRGQAALERLLDDRRATPEAIAEAKDLADVLQGYMSTEDRERVTHRLERLASSGRAPWRDQGIEISGIVVTQRIAAIDEEMDQLSERAQGADDPQDLRRIELELSKLARLRASLVQARALGDTLADAKGLPDATRRRVMALLERIHNEYDPAKLDAIVAELRRLVPRPGPRPDMATSTPSAR